MVGEISVFVEPGDRLDEVPESHRPFITSEIRRVFPDPVGWISEASSKSRLPELKAYLRTLADAGAWELELFQGDPPEWHDAAYCWFADGVRPSLIAPPGEVPDDLPEVWRHYGSLVGAVHWIGLDAAGALYPGGRETIAEAFGAESDWLPNGFEAGATYLCGSGPHGDSMIWTEDDCGGWFSHETGRIHPLGSIEDLIEWFYGRLNRQEAPNFDPAWYGT